MTIVEFKPQHTVITIGDQTVKWPSSRNDLLQLCKRFLTEDDYIDLLTGIMDPQLYETIDPDLQSIVDSYYKFTA